jgi:gliding motility-associated-like protein
MTLFYFLVSSILCIIPSFAQTLYTFNYTGAAQNWTVPPCVTSITVTLKGGKGGGSNGGNGATVSGVMAVTPGQVLQIRVGGQGVCPGSIYQGGGQSSNTQTLNPQPCSGGGLSAILVAPYANANIVAVAAGGGGKAGGDMGGAGGNGGCATGAAGTSPFGQGGQGGTQTAGGAGGPPWTAGGGSGTAGSQLQGGTGGNDIQYKKAGGGGGGGGWYGGGGGGSDNINANSFIGGGGGGGGSSFTPAGWACGAGNNAGPGQVTILASVSSGTIAVNSATICAGQTAVLTASGNTSYTWQPGGSTANPLNVSPGSTTTYTVTGGAAGCTASITTQVVVNPLPNPIAGSNSPVCINKPINFTGSGGTTYTWTGPGGFTSNAQNPTIASATAGNAGTYTLGVTNANGCINYTTVAVVVNPLPVIAVTNPTACVGGNINLSATGGSTYQWSGPNAYTSNQQYPVIANSTTGMSGAYTVTVTTAQGCTNTAVSNVSVTTLPMPNIISNSPVCAGAILSFTGSGGGSYSWTGPNGFTSTLQNPSITNVTTAASGTYSLIATIGSCSNIATASVVVNPLPNPTAVNNSPLCVNQTLNLTGGGGAATYTWTGPNGFTSNLQSPSISSASLANAGVYTLQVTSSGNCTNSITTNVVVNTLPVVAVTHPTVCLNTAINLSANGGATYAWTGPSGFSSSLQNPVINNAASSNAGVYNVVVTSAQGCTSTANSTVTVLALPVATIGNNTPCVGSTLTFTGSGGTTFNWSGPNGFTSASQNPTIPSVTLPANGVYTLVVTAGTCSSSITQAVTINPLPNPVANSNSPVCEFQTINLTAAGGTNYSWNGPSGFNSTLQNPVIANSSLVNSGTYTVVVTDANSCSSTTVTTVIVNTLPVIAVTNPTVCFGQAINLSSNGGVSYSWSGPLGYTSAQQNPVIANSTTQMGGLYTVTVTSAQNCSTTAQSSVTVLPLPVPTITSNTPCVGQTLQLTAGGGFAYQWSGPNNFSSTNSTPTIPNVSTAAGGTYTLIASVGNCTNITTGQIVINPIPTPNITGNSPVCLNEMLTMNATGGSGVVWSGPAGFSSNSASVSIGSAAALNAGVYTATVTDANGCSSTANYFAVVNPLPAIAISGSTVCANQSVYLSANGGTAYAWAGPQGYTSNNSSPIIPGATTQMSGTYTVTVISSGGCVASSVTAVQVNSLPTPTAVSNSPVCVNQTITLSATSGSTLSYTWAGPNSFSAYNQNVAIRPAQPLHAGIYTVTGMDNLGCIGTATVEVIVHSLPEGSVFADKTSGCIPLCVTFSCAASASVQSCLWDLGIGLTASGNSVTRCYDRDGPYIISAYYTDLNGCTSTSIFTINVFPKPHADFNFAPQRPVENSQVDFTNSSYGAGITNYNWSFSHQPNTVNTQQSPTMIFENPGGYLAVLIVTNDKGCTDTVMKPIIIGEDYGLYVPEAFTPNGDGINDEFFPKGYGIVTYEMSVFNRWGEKLFSTGDFAERWKGNYQGRSDDIVEDGVYIWLIKGTNVFGKSIELTGKVLLYK